MLSHPKESLCYHPPISHLETHTPISRNPKLPAPPGLPGVKVITRQHRHHYPNPWCFRLSTYSQGSKGRWGPSRARQAPAWAGWGWNQPQTCPHREVGNKLFLSLWKEIWLRLSLDNRAAPRDPVSHSVTQVGLQLTILLPQHLQSWEN